MIDILNKEQLEEFIWENKDKIVVIYFGAEWCGPCKSLKKSLALPETQINMPDLAVCHIDLDEEESACLIKLYNISSIPVQIFVTLKGTQIIELNRIVGYDWPKFQDIYKLITSTLHREVSTIE